MSDLITRISELAGYEAAAAIVAEFGGKTIVVRRAVSANVMVRCRDCIHINRTDDWNNKCRLDNRHVGANSNRYCELYLAETATTGMHPADIKAVLKKNGASQAKIADAMKVSRSTVSYVIKGRSKSRRIADAISQATGIPVDRLWPGKYPFTDDQRLAA